MKFIRRNRSRAPQLALTSMLDVIFLLLCFFVTVSVFSQWESEISIKLPGADTGEEPERLPGEIIVNLAKDGVGFADSVFVPRMESALTPFVPICAPMTKFVGEGSSSSWKSYRKTQSPIGCSST